jgi:hypothetical protein
MSSFPISSHGIAIPMYNATGVTIPKGSCVSVATTGDFHMKPTPVDDSYTVQGFTALDTKNGQWGQVVQVGMAQMLLEDGTGAGRGEWIRSSLVTAGRVAVQQKPGMSFNADSLDTGTLIDGTASRGVASSGTVANLANTNNSYLVLTEVGLTPGTNLTITFNDITVLPSSLLISGYYPFDHINGIDISIWDYTHSAWVLAAKIPQLTYSTIMLSFDLITTDMLSSGTMTVLVNHPDQGSTGHRIYLDALTFISSEDHEHFKELGHILENKTAGINTLAWGSIHLL